MADAIDEVYGVLDSAEGGTLKLDAKAVEKLRELVQEAFNDAWADGYFEAGGVGDDR